MTWTQFQSFFAEKYYRLTAKIPRPLPKTQGEIQALRDLLTKYFGLEFDEVTNYTFLSQLTSGPPTSLWKDYASIANACKKLSLAKLVMVEKELANERNRRKLEELFKQEAEARIGTDGGSEIIGSHSDHADVQNWPHDIQKPLQVVSEPPLGMVEIPGGNGL